MVFLSRSDHTAHHGQPVLIAVLVAALALAVIGAVFALLVYGSLGTAATQTRTVARFTSLDLAGSNNVTIIVGRPQSVVVHAGSTLINHVTTQVVAGTLVIGDTGRFTASGPMSVDVRVPSLTALSLSGSGQISATGIRTPQLTVTISGSGLVSAAGTATWLDATINGSGKAQLSQLTARAVHAVVSGSGPYPGDRHNQPGRGSPRLRHDHLQRQPATGHHQRHRLWHHYTPMSSHRGGRTAGEPKRQARDPLPARPGPPLR